VVVIVILVVAAVLLFTGINRRRVATPVRAEKVVRQEIASVISTNGKIEPINSFEAHAPAPATVNKVLVAEGDHVKAGSFWSNWTTLKPARKQRVRWHNCGRQKRRSAVSKPVEHRKSS